MRTKLERLLWTHDDLDMHDPRRAEKDEAYLDWVDDITEVEAELIRIYFAEKGVPAEIAEDFIFYVEWNDNRHLAPIIRFLRERAKARA